MVLLVGDADFCNEVESMKSSTSSCEAQDVIFYLYLVLNETVIDSHVLIKRLQSLLCYSNSKGWEEVIEQVLEVVEQGGVLHRLVGADIYSFY